MYHKCTIIVPVVPTSPRPYCPRGECSTAEGSSSPTSGWCRRPTARKLVAGEEGSQLPGDRRLTSCPVAVAGERTDGHRNWLIINQSQIRRAAKRRDGGPGRTPQIRGRRDFPTGDPGCKVYLVYLLPIVRCALAFMQFINKFDPWDVSKFLGSWTILNMTRPHMTTTTPSSSWPSAFPSPLTLTSVRCASQRLCRSQEPWLVLLSMWYPTTNGGSSVGIYTHCIHVFFHVWHRFLCSVGAY